MKRKVSNVQYDPDDPDEHAIPGGWNRQEEANNTQYDHCPVKDTIKKILIIPGG